VRVSKWFLCLAAGLVAGLTSAGQPAGGFGESWIGGYAERGETLCIRPPVAELMENIGSRIDGGGMCVDTSVETDARVKGLDGYRGFRDYFAQTEEGGNTPSGLERQLAAWAQAKGLPPPEYVQYYGPDPGPILDACERTGRGCCVAYGYSPRYGQAINHMVYCPHPGKPGGFAAICDNNVFGGLTKDESRRYEWMARAEFETRLKTQADQWGRAVRSRAWVFAWLAPPPPPSPKPFPA